MSPWLLRHSPRARPRARLFCFPYAGVGASAYRLWPRGLPEDLDVCAVQLPGRESRLRETPATRIDDVVAALLPELEPLLDLPFAFFGHSMGAVVATEVTRALEARGGPLPRHLVVSARRPVHIPGTEPLLHVLDDAGFLAAIQRRYGPIAAEILAEPDVMAMLLPCLRADIAALETHRPPQRPPLPCPIAVFGGSADPATPREHLDAWRDETTSTFRVRVFPGDHFYLTAARVDLLADLTATLAPLLSHTQPSTGTSSSA